jgi:ParB-like chromosome segregation protein Spo0J
MTPEELVATTDGGTDALEAVPDLELRMVDPEAIAVDPMNERTDEPLETEELERSVAENGVVEPPVCRVRDPDARVPYAVVQGQRRVTAAQAVQFDEIPILVGEFDDKRALIRSITENIKAGRKDVTTKTRAAAIWELWKLDQGDDPEAVPNVPRIAELLGVNSATARRWIQPLEKEYVDTVIDPRVNEQTENTVEEMSVELDDVSPHKLNHIRQIVSTSDQETAERLVERVVEEDLSVQDVRDMTKQPSATEDPFQALEEVKRAKEASEEARGFMLDRMRFGDETGGAIEQAARATGKDKSAVIKDAVQYYLREEGYL